MLLKTVTAFTVAHSITLAIATLGYAAVPALPLNAAIALSILFLGPEIVRAWRGETSFTIRHPWVVAFAFGLLHGFGFASALDRRRPAAQRAAAGAAQLQRRRRARPARLHRADSRARARVPAARDPLAALGAAAARLRGRHARRVLDDPARGAAVRSAAMRRVAAEIRAAMASAPLGRRPRSPTCSRARRRLPDRIRCIRSRTRPRAGDGRRRPVGRAAWRARDLGAAGRLSDGHGVGRHARPAWACRCRASRTVSPLGHPARRRGAVRGTRLPLVVAASWSASSRSSTATRTAPSSRRAERAALQHGLRDRDRLPACARHRHRHCPPLAVGTDTVARRRRRSRCRRCSSCGEPSHERGARCRACALRSAGVLSSGRPTRTSTRPAWGRLRRVTHFLTSPEDLLRRSRWRCWRVRGAPHGRRAMFTLPAAWLLGSLFGLSAAATTASVGLALVLVSAAWRTGRRRCELSCAQ